MTAVLYRGRSYGAETDWRSVLREAASHEFGPSWLRPDLDVASGLADLVDQFRGTAVERSVAEAAIEIIESGNSAERVAVWQLPWEQAANAVERLLHLVETDRARLDEVRGVPNVLWRLLLAAPNDERVLDRLRIEAAVTPPDPRILKLASKFKP
jgi:hypothetical protein